MIMWDTIWSGIKFIFVGGVKIVAGVANALWEVMKFAVKTAVWVVAGIFTIAKHFTTYIAKTISELFKPTTGVFIPRKKIPSLVDYVQQEAERDGIAEDPEVLEITRKLNNAVENKEGLLFAIGEDESGQAAVSDPTFVSADQYDDKIADANENNRIYLKKIRVAY